MSIDGLGNIYSIPEIKKEHKTGMEQKKKQQKGREENRKNEEDEQDIKEGKVDIRI